MAQGNTRLARRLLWFAAFVNMALLLMLCPLAVTGGGAVIMALLVTFLVDGFVGAYALEQGLLFELLMERTWKAVCRGIGFIGKARSFRFGLIGAFVLGDTKTIYPKLRDVHGTHENWTGIVIPFAGHTIEEYNKHQAAFALAFHVPFCTFDLAENGLIGIRAGNVPVPDAYNHSGHIQMLQDPDNRALPQQPLSIDEIPQRVLKVAEQFQQSRGVQNVYGHVERANVWAYELSLLQGVPIAKDLNGRTCLIPIQGQHWFVAARTGQGKGSWIWSLVLGLEPAWRLGLVRYWGCDPKRLELAIGQGWWQHYADTDESMVELLEQAVSEMFAVGDGLKGKVRKFTPSRSTPLNVVVIDELGYLSSMLNDRKLQTRAHSAIKTLLTQGRSNGYAVIGAAIDVRKEAVSFREEFPIKIAGSMPAEMVDLVLGKGMHDAGAYCEQIPLGKAGAGVAYVISETTLKPVLVRAAWCSDDDIRGMLSSVSARPQPLLDAGGTAAQVKDEPTGQLDWNGQPLPGVQDMVD